VEMREVFECVDLHVAGVPVRVVESGLGPWPPADTQARLRTLERTGEEARRRLMHEPWGFAGLRGAVLLPPEREGSAAGVVFMDQARYAAACARGLVAVAAHLAATGRAGAAAGRDGRMAVRLDTAAGPASVDVALAPDGGAPRASLRLGPARAVMRARPLAPAVAQAHDLAADVCSLGAHRFAFVPSPWPLDLEPANLLAVRDAAPSLARAAMAATGADTVALVEGAPRPDGSLRLVGIDQDGGVARAPGLAMAAAYSAILEERADAVPRPWRAAGLAGVAIDVTAGARDDDGALLVDVAAAVHVIAWRRLFVDPADEVAPFLVP
jgi:proline racemase